MSLNLPPALCGGCVVAEGLWSVGNVVWRDCRGFGPAWPGFVPPLGCHSPLCWCDLRLFPSSGFFDMIDGSRSEISGESLRADGLLTRIGHAISSGAFPAWHVNVDENPKEKPLERNPCAALQPFHFSTSPVGRLRAAACFAHKRGKNTWVVMTSGWPRPCDLLCSKAQRLEMGGGQLCVHWGYWEMSGFLCVSPIGEKNPD